MLASTVMSFLLSCDIIFSLASSDGGKVSSLFLDTTASKMLFILVL